MRNLKNRRLWLGNILLMLSLLANGCILLPEEQHGQTATIPAKVDTSTPTERVDIPTAAAEETETVATSTAQPVDTETPLPMSTNTSQPTDEPTQAPEPTAIPFLYQIQEGTPAYIKNFAHPEAGCNWLGAAGQIFDKAGDPVLNLVALVSGQYGGRELEAIGVSGTGDGDNYGPGGFEIVIGTSLAATDDKLSIQLFDLDGVPVSDAFYFDTYNSCDKNLVIINFVAVD